jgi:hypothetical protein
VALPGIAVIQLLEAANLYSEVEATLRWSDFIEKKAKGRRSQDPSGCHVVTPSQP